MSRLADKIKRAGRVETAPIGFGVPAERRVIASMLCLLRLDKDDAKKVAQAAAAADAFIVTGADAGKLSDTLRKPGRDRPPRGQAPGARGGRATAAAAGPPPRGAHRGAAAVRRRGGHRRGGGAGVRI